MKTMSILQLKSSSSGKNWLLRGVSLRIPVFLSLNLCKWELRTGSFCMKSWMRSHQYLFCPFQDSCVSVVKLYAGNIGEA